MLKDEVERGRVGVEGGRRWGGKGWRERALLMGGKDE